MSGDLPSRARGSSSSSSTSWNQEKKKPQETRVLASTVLADPKLRSLMDDRQVRILENVRKQRSEPSEAQGALVMEIKAELEERAEDDEKPKRSYAEVYGFFSKAAMKQRLADLERVRADGPWYDLDERIQALRARIAAMDDPESEPSPIRRAMPPRELRGSVQEAQQAQCEAHEGKLERLNKAKALRMVSEARRGATG